MTVQQFLPELAVGVQVPIIGEVQTEPTTLRHLEEKERLLDRLDKSRGTYNVHHPRWRLLRTLWSFSKYRDFSKADVQRWRDMYKSTSKQQKDVSKPPPPESFQVTSNLHDAGARIRGSIPRQTKQHRAPR